MRRPLLALALAALSLTLLARCELAEEPLDVASSNADTTGGEDATTADEDVIAAAPVPCARLQGQWMLSVCGGNAAIAQLVVSGCTFSLTSPAPELHGGVGALSSGNVLTVDLPGGVWGALRCTAEATVSTVSGTCAGVQGTCPFAGVKSF